ncbi:MAG: hypothetical protein HY744_26955, partial [Deltaproteobacteria bacterium]|nr:hypothetical protein [Deltaproteobacteria bacterium]
MTPRAWRAAAGAALAAALGCGLPPAPPGPPAVAHDLRVVPGRLDPRRWLESSAKLAGSAGAGPLQPVAAAVVAGGDQLGGFVQLGPGECLLALARAARSIDDVDLFVFSDAGELLGA